MPASVILLAFGVGFLLVYMGASLWRALHLQAQAPLRLATEPLSWLGGLSLSGAVLLLGLSYGAPLMALRAALVAVVLILTSPWEQEPPWTAVARSSMALLLTSLSLAAAMCRLPIASSITSSPSSWMLGVGSALCAGLAGRAAASVLGQRILRATDGDASRVLVSVAYGAQIVLLSGAWLASLWRYGRLGRVEPFDDWLTAIWLLWGAAWWGMPAGSWAASACYGLTAIVALGMALFAV